MGDPAPPRRRTHGGTGAGALALVKPLPPKAVAGRSGFTRAKRLGHNRHRRTDGLRFKTMSCASSVSAGTKSPIRNSIEPEIGYTCGFEPRKYLSISIGHLAGERAT